MTKPKKPDVDPFDTGHVVEGGPHIMCCPVCGSTEFDAHHNQWTTWRDCRKCGNSWGGGSAAQPDFVRDPEALQIEPGLHPGMPAPDDDLDDLPRSTNFRNRSGRIFEYGDD